MKQILKNDATFKYPKSLYAVKDTIGFFVKNKKDALIVDFFAGSGTTLHAVNLLNSEDDGQRRCIMVTNNEISGDEAKALEKKVHKKWFYYDNDTVGTTKFTFKVDLSIFLSASL